MGLFEQELQVLNVGLASFADEIVQAGGKATRIEWTPPAGGDCAAGMALARLVNDAAVEAANRRAFAAYLNAQPELVGIGLAHDVISGMNAQRILHAGPPIEWDRMRGPMQGAIVGAILTRAGPRATKPLSTSSSTAMLLLRPAIITARSARWPAS